MVRVLTAHHFASQDIQTCDDPLAVAPVPPDKLLIALSVHVIEVRDLSKNGVVVSTFPTVDLVHQMVYCSAGNYVSTLEGKNGRLVYVRVYANWDTGVQPMRARIAGRVTPSLSQGDAQARALEMIELPLKAAPVAVATCQTTGNILVASRRGLTLYRFCVRTHEVSRLRFIDFEDSDLSISLTFTPSCVFLCEDLVTCMGKHYLLVCQLLPSSAKVNVERAAERAGKQSTDALNLPDIIRMEQEVNSGRRSMADVGISLPVTVQLPAIAAERASRGHCSPGSGVVHHSNPFVSDPVDVVASVSGSQEYRAEPLLRLQLAADPQGGHGEEFCCLAVQPLFKRSDSAPATPSLLTSGHRSKLCAVVCLAATQQEGYLYHFPLDGSRPAAHPCVAVYPFTAPVSSVVLEPFALHALTETGLETYTLRSAHRTLQVLQPVCPPADDSICLIGLRPFLGVRYLEASGPYLVLLATSDGSPSEDGRNTDPWTLYSLRLPSPEVLSADMVAVGESHRVASPSTYCQLLGEAHCVLSSARLLGSSCDELRLKSPDDSSPEDAGALEALYCESCAHLGDFHIVSDDPADRDLAAQYYRMSRLPPTRVLERMRRYASRVQDSAEGESAADPTDAALSRAQTHFLTNQVLTADQKDDQKDDQTLRQLAGWLLDILEAKEPDQELTRSVALLILRARVLREYCVLRSLQLLRKIKAACGGEDAAVVMALLVLEVQQGTLDVSADGALQALQKLDAEDLVRELAAHWALLVDSSEKDGQSTRSLSEVAGVLLEKRPEEMATLLSRLESTGVLPLAVILKMMLNFLSTQIGTSGSVVSVVFQRFLELYFAAYYTANTKDSAMSQSTEEALKILIRSYLSDLQSGLSGSSPAAVSPLQSVLLECERLAFLDAMPPFAADLGECLASPVRQPNGSPRSAFTTETKKLSLKKLQALLCSGRVPRVCVSEILRFVRGQPKLCGNLSLQVLCLPVKEATALLLDFCPQAVLHYARDVYRDEDEWKLLLTGLQCKGQSHGPQQPLHFVYEQTSRDVLDHLAHTLDVDTLCRLLPAPPGGADDELEVVRAHLAHLHTCQRVASANQIRGYITRTSVAFLAQLDQ